MIRIGVNIRPRFYGGGTDADAQAFITAAGITDATQQSAINTLVTDLKAFGVWTKMKAIYPFVGGTSSTHKWNLKDPRDLDAAFRLVFNGGWTHSSTGALPNGTNAYADTYLSPAIVINDNNDGHLSYYSRTNNTGINAIEIGCADPVTAFDMVIKFGSNLGGACINMFDTNVFTNTARSDGFYVASQNNVNNIRDLYRNGTSLSTQNVSQNANPQSNYTVFIGARNGTSLGTAMFFSNRECSFASIGNGLSATETTNFYTAVQKYQTTLGRQVGVPIVADSDAQAFLNAAVITDVTQANAVDKLVTDLKGFGIWSKMRAIYPFVGGTASSHRFNLKDPRDLDAAFRLVFNGGITHSSTGILPGGVNGFASTYITPSSSLSTANWHFSYYSRTNNNSNADFDMGVGDSLGNYSSALFLRRSNNTAAFDSGNATSANRITATSQTNSQGFYVGSIRSTTNRVLIKNGTSIIASSTANNTNILMDSQILLFAYNERAFNSPGTSANYYGSKQCAFASIGDGLTDTEAANLYTAVQAYQTSLNRNV